MDIEDFFVFRENQEKTQDTSNTRRGMESNEEGAFDRWKKNFLFGYEDFTKDRDRETLL